MISSYLFASSVIIVLYYSYTALFHMKINQIFEDYLKRKNVRKILYSNKNEIGKSSKFNVLFFFINSSSLYALDTLKKNMIMNMYIASKYFYINKKNYYY